MATTTYGVNDSLTVKLWAKGLAREALKASEIAPLIGSGSNSVIQEKTETKKASGDRVTIGLRMQLTGDGVLGDPPGAVGLSAFDALELGDRVGKAHEDEVRALGGVQAQVVILGLDGRTAREGARSADVFDRYGRNRPPP